MSETSAVGQEDILNRRIGDLPPAEQRVVLKVLGRAAIARKLAAKHQEESTFGERLADQVAAIGGSWGFIITFGLILVFWMGMNSIVLILMHAKPFDPYPYIFLNLMLSTLAALQAPVIMMSQNRQGIKDRLAAEHDYEVNLKAEVEILALHEKLDALRDQQLSEVAAQQLQILKELKARSKAPAKS